MSPWTYTRTYGLYFIRHVGFQSPLHIQVLHIGKIGHFGQALPVERGEVLVLHEVRPALAQLQAEAQLHGDGQAPLLRRRKPCK